ncbi:MAG: sugar ABC transporter permease [Chloroflexi bacterium]|nr:sugar ABC transporter permease [Chloroflexota bacterium]
MTRSARRDLRDGLLFCSPYILGIILFWAGPMLYSIFLITQKWNMLVPPEYIGLGNITRLVGDPLVKKSLLVTAYYTFVGVPLQLAVAFGLAVLLNLDIKGQSVFRTVYYLPSITPAVALGVVWLQILNPQYGVVNAILGWFGIAPIKWLFDPVAAMPAFIMMSLFTVGPAMIIFLAGLQSVPPEVLEAATIDGAGNWGRFWKVKVPVISPIVFFNLVMGIIGSFQVFTASFVMTRGGPQNATLFFVLYIYNQAFELLRMGYAAVLSWVLFIIIMVFTTIQFALGRRWVYYGGEL